MPPARSHVTDLASGEVVDNVFSQRAERPVQRRGTAS